MRSIQTWAVLLLFLCANTSFVRAEEDRVPGARRVPLAPPDTQVDKYAPELVRWMSEHPSSRAIPVLVVLTQQLDLGAYQGGRTGAESLIRSLQQTARDSQTDLLRVLLGRSDVTNLRSFWIQNLVALSATEPLLAELAARADVARIELDERVIFPGLMATRAPAPAGEDPVSTPSPAKGHSGAVPSGPRAVDWNLSLIGADQIWSTLGLEGTGIVIGSMDTGFDPDHPALIGKWRGGSNSWIDIQNGLPSPYDDHGHGTHTIGTLVGGDGPGPFPEDIGICYGARFISAKVLDASNSFSSASIVIAGAQWMLDPDGNPGTDDFPHVINNSWLFFSPTYSGFHGSAAAWRAAGIIPVFCIGNNGPSPGTTNPPGNYNNTIGVGATTATDAVAGFSGRGPSPVGAVFPADRRKPDLSAPGQAVRSSVPGGGYAYWDGTSMAAPHVAATAALMLQAHLSYTYDQIRQILCDTAVDLGSPGYDYDFGYGRLDALAAVSLAAGSVLTLGPEPSISLYAAPNPFESATSITYRGPLSPASIEVFDACGRMVRSLAAPASGNQVLWDGLGGGGSRLPAGHYYVRARVGATTAGARVVRLR